MSPVLQPAPVLSFSEASVNERFVFLIFSVGKVKVPEGVGAVAARHGGEQRDEKCLWTELVQINMLSLSCLIVCLLLRRSTRTRLETWSTRKRTRT